MTDLTHPRLLWLKACLFVACGVIAAGLLLLEQPTLRSALLLGVTVWCFCRAYYFAFYVLERYVDPTARYAGLMAMVRERLRTRGARVPGTEYWVLGTGY